jgi:transcriptional regulator with XRE-family HTH domain
LQTHPDDRRKLASGLRALRLDGGLSTTELAKRLGWSQAKVSRVERGVTLAKPPEVDQWAAELNCAPELRRHLVALAEREGLELTRYKQAAAPGRRKRQEEIKDLESRASTLWMCPIFIVPGLTQTRQYASMIFTIGRSRAAPSDEVADAVAARMARQSVLDDDSKNFNMLFAETAVRRSLLAKDEMKEQIERLIEESRRENVSMGMIPFAARERTLMYHGFSIIGDPDVDERSVALVSTLTRSITIRDPDEVREYIAHYRRLAEGAVFGDELRGLLREISEEAPWS